MGKNARNRKHTRNVAKHQSPAAATENSFKDMVFNPAPWLGYATDALARISMRLSHSGDEAFWTLQGKKGVHAELLIAVGADGTSITWEADSPTTPEVADALGSITHAVKQALFNDSTIDYVAAVGWVAVVMADFFHLVNDVPQSNTPGGVLTQAQGWESLRQAYADAHFERSDSFPFKQEYSRGFTLLCGARVDIRFTAGAPDITYPATCEISEEINYFMTLWAASYAIALQLKHQNGEQYFETSLELRSMLQLSIAQSMLATVLSSHTGEGCGPHEFALPSWLLNTKNSEYAA